jgi:hypothetical protein
MAGRSFPHTRELVLDLQAIAAQQATESRAATALGERHPVA